MNRTGKIISSPITMSMVSWAFLNMHVDTGLSQNFFSRQNAYRDTLFAILPHHSEDYLMRKEVMLTVRINGMKH